MRVLPINNNQGNYIRLQQTKGKESLNIGYSSKSDIYSTNDLYFKGAILQQKVKN